MNYVLLSMIIEFGTPKQWKILLTNLTAWSEVFMMGHACIHLVNLLTVTRTCV